MLKKREKKTGKSGRKITVCSSRVNDVPLTNQMKEKIQKEYYHRIRMVLKSELNSANKLEATNTLAVTVVPYSLTS